MKVVCDCNKVIEHSEDIDAFTGAYVFRCEDCGSVYNLEKVGGEEDE